MFCEGVGYIGKPVTWVELEQLRSAVITCKAYTALSLSQPSMQRRYYLSPRPPTRSSRLLPAPHTSLLRASSSRPGWWRPWSNWTPTWLAWGTAGRAAASPWPRPGTQTWWRWASRTFSTTLPWGLPGVGQVQQYCRAAVQGRAGCSSPGWSSVLCILVLTMFSQVLLLELKLSLKQGQEVGEGEVPSHNLASR